MLTRCKNRKDHKEKKLKQNRWIGLPKQKCFKFSAEVRECVTRNNVCWQTVPQPSTSSGGGSITKLPTVLGCTLRLAPRRADVQLMGQCLSDERRRRLDGIILYLNVTAPVMSAVFSLFGCRSMHLYCFLLSGL